MRIALDYDGTYTQDPILWANFIAESIGRGHEVICVTMRHPEDEPIVGMPCEIIYTDRQPKMSHMVLIGRPTDVWIDDHPEWLAKDAQ